MRKRHMLLRRQRILAPHLLRRQPLVRYIVRQHTLADALGLVEEEKTHREQPVEGPAQRWWPLQTEQLLVSTGEQAEEEAFASFEPSMPMQAVSQSAPENPEPVQPEEAQSGRFDPAQLEQAEALRRSEPISPDTGGWDGSGRVGSPGRHGVLQDSVNVAAPLARAAVPTGRHEPSQTSAHGAALLTRAAASTASHSNPRFSAERSEPTRLRQGERARITELPSDSERSVLPTLMQEEDGLTDEALPLTEVADLLSSSTFQDASAREAAIDARQPDAEEPRPAQTNGELFASRGLDRSPQAWLARLNRRAQSEMQQTRNRATPASAPREIQNRAIPVLTPREVQKQVVSVPRMARGQVAPDVEQARGARRETDRAEPVAQNTRTFLKPLLGVDPASVPVYRDAQAEVDTESARADALSDGETIELAAEHSAPTPATLGLLAHELTHVLRRQNPRFVPPVVRGTQEATSETRDEEALALQVERQTIRMARTAQAVPFASVARPMARGAREASEEAESFKPEHPVWGELPAPWEPLPDWLTTWPADTEANLPPSARPPSLPVSALPLPPASVSEGHSEGAPEVKRAGLERSTETSESENAGISSSQTEPERVPEPDLDALAQQVYTLLKRRLAVEQRREL